MGRRRHGCRANRAADRDRPADRHWSAPRGCPAGRCWTARRSPAGNSAGSAIAVPSPKLEVSIVGPQAAAVGSQVSFGIQVVNRGTATATGVVVTDRFDAGLERPGTTGNQIENSLVDLPPGGVDRLGLTLRMTQAGQWCQEITVTAQGGAQATTRHCIVANGPAAQPPVEQPPADQPPSDTQPTPNRPPIDATPPAANAPVAVKMAGPSRQSVGEIAPFTIDVTNVSDQPLEELRIADNFETSMQPKGATKGSKWLAGGALRLGDRHARTGESVQRQIDLRCLRPTPQACNRVTITASGVEPVGADACLEIVAADADTPPAAQPAGQVSVTVAETADPIQVNGETTYQVVITNNGAQSAFDVTLTATYSEELTLVGMNGPVRRPAQCGAPSRSIRSASCATAKAR